MSFSIHVLINNSALTITSSDIKNVKSLALPKKIIDSLDDVYEISITDKLVILTTENPYFRDGAKQAPVYYEKVWQQNNINAYDWDGNHLWNIADIVGPIHHCFYGGCVTTKELFREDFSESLYEEIGNHALYACTAGSILYVIDLETQRVIQTMQTK